MAREERTMPSNSQPFGDASYTSAKLILKPTTFTEGCQNTRSRQLPGISVHLDTFPCAEVTDAKLQRSLVTATGFRGRNPTAQVSKIQHLHLPIANKLPGTPVKLNARRLREYYLPESSNTLYARVIVNRVHLSLV